MVSWQLEKTGATWSNLFEAAHFWSVSHDWVLAPALALEIRFRQLAGKAKDWLEKVEVTLSGMNTLWCWNYVGCHSIFMV
jgi:hypothetical protein